MDDNLRDKALRAVADAELDSAAPRRLFAVKLLRDADCGTRSTAEYVAAVDWALAQPRHKDDDAVGAVARRLHRIAVQWGGESRGRTWADLDEQGRDYWRGEARELLADAAAHGCW